MTSTKNQLLRRIALALLFASLVPSGLRAQAPVSRRAAQVPIMHTILDRIPVDYREAAKEFNLTDTDAGQRTALEFADRSPQQPRLVGYVIGELSKNPQAVPFLLVQLEKEPDSRVRTYLAQNIGRPYENSPAERQQQIRFTLEKHGLSDADATVSLAAMTSLREIRLSEVEKVLRSMPDNFEKIADDIEKKMLSARMELAWKVGDTAGLEKLSKQEARWSTERPRVQWPRQGAQVQYQLPARVQYQLPVFLQVPPPVFAVRPPNEPIRVVAISDSGTALPQQEAVAATLAHYHREHPFDFGITVGDNYQEQGPDSWTNERWQKYWQKFYPALGISFYAILGNHDWFSPDGPAAEILYSQKDPSWKLPSPYYTFTAGPVQFFAVDTIFMTEGHAQLLWLRKELQKSTAKWKVVYGHYPIYSAAPTGGNKKLRQRLLPILLQNHVDVYLCGNEHVFQHLQSEGGVHFFVNGSAGLEGHKPNPYGRPGFVDYDRRSGFTVLEASESSLRVTFVGEDGKQFYEYTLTR